MIHWARVLTLLHVMFSVNADLHNLNSVQHTSKCQYAPGLTVGNRTTELECCERVVHDYYYSNLKPHNRYLTTFLESLQTWNCPQFQQECEQPTFNYTDFTSLMYLRFCNRSLMEALCYDDIVSIATKQNNEIETTTKKFSQLVSKLNLVTLNEEDLMNPCVQVAMYDSNSGNQGHYHEIIEPAVPFCSYVWCGFNENLFTKRHVSPWTCMRSRCRFIVVVYVVLKICLALAIVICNATILGVISLKKQDVQSIYRMSLAVADFIVGLVVIPLNFGTGYWLLVRSPPFTDFRNASGYVIANDSSLPTQTVVVELRGLHPEKSLGSYVFAIGFFDVLSLWLSVSSLVAASCDRFVAIYRPLRYKKSKAIFAAKITVVSLWFLGSIVALLPVLTGYSVDFIDSESSDKKSMRLVYAILFFLALVLMWFLIIATYVAARPSLRTHDKQHHTDDEMRLLGTLGVMIAVFTVCIVPNAIILILSYNNTRNPTGFDVVAASQFMSVKLSAHILLISNSLWNCFIYSFRETTFRSAVKLLYKRIAKFLKLDQIWNLISRKT